MKDNKENFDVILSCDGPQIDEKEIIKHCKYFVRVGYRPKSLFGAFTDINILLY